MNYSELFIETKLPKPLKKEELIECIKKAREGDLEARDKAIIHNVKLVFNQVIKKFANSPYEPKELVSIGIIGLVKAVDTFDITKKINFTTYAVRCIDNEILMFMRKCNKYLKDESLEQPLASDTEDEGLRVKDTIADENSEFTENILKREILLEIKRQVDMLNDRDKEIIKLYFGFYEDKQYSQKEIATMLGLSQSYISRIINRVIDTIGKKLEEQNLIERTTFNKIISKTNKKQKKRKEETEKMAKKLQTIYDYFNQYTREQINEMLTKLTQEERELITLRYGTDLDYPKTSEKWNKENNTKFYGSLVPKMKRLLSNPNKKERKNIQTKPIAKKEVTPEDKITEQSSDVKPSNKDSITKEEYVKILELLKTATFSQMLELLSPKEAIIISLRLGYVDGKYFSTESIAKFLEIEEDEVRKITMKILLLYKENINEVIDKAIETIAKKQPTLSLKPNN